MTRFGQKPTVGLNFHCQDILMQWHSNRVCFHLTTFREQIVGMTTILIVEMHTTP